MFYGVSQTFSSVEQCQRRCLEEAGCLGFDWNNMNSVPVSLRCFLIYSWSLFSNLQPISDTCCDHYRKKRCTHRDRSENNGQVHTASFEDFRGAENKIPDSGCPYAYQKFPYRSHPFGQNVSIREQNDSMEKCKRWCLVRSFCQGVDFDVSSSTCYYLREVHEDLLEQADTVVHFRKTKCPPPLHCWNTPLSVVSSISELRVKRDAKDGAALTSCYGICYVTQTIGKRTVIERGCQSRAEVGGRLGCYVNGDVANGFQTIVCYCDTVKCNGLSIEALVTQMLYLPLDGDTLDHSGLGHHGSTPLGRSPQTFTCLDRVLNCSAVFSGHQCITVSSLGLTVLSSVEATEAFTGESTATLVPRATFVVSYKRVPSFYPSRQGVLGNSASPDSQATWAFYADNVTDTSTAGIITDGTQLQSTEDYKYAEASDGTWHQHVLVYDGKNSPLSTLNYFIDGKEMTGNARLESGNISVRNQPVAIGCLEGLDFIGLIDEVRIFSTSLDPMDIDALLAMTNE